MEPSHFEEADFFAIPALDDLILTKRFAARPKDAEDIRMLEALRSEESQ